MYLSYQSTKRLVYPKRIWKNHSRGRAQRAKSAARQWLWWMAGAVHSFYWRRIQSVVPMDPCRHPSEKTNQPPLRPQPGLRLRESGPGLERVLARCPVGRAAPSPDEVHEAAGPPAQCKDRTRVHTRRPLSTPRRPPLRLQLGKGRARVQPLPHAAGKELVLSKSPDLRIPCPPTMLRMMPLLPGPLVPVAMWSSAKDQ